MQQKNIEGKPEQNDFSKIHLLLLCKTIEYEKTIMHML